MNTKPTLKQGSAQRVRGTKIKKDPNDCTISVSDSLSVSFNHDYDGDEMQLTLCIDKWMEEAIYPFSPFFNLLQLTKPLEISNTLYWSDPIVASVSDWIEAQRYPNGPT